MLRIVAKFGFRVNLAELRFGSMAGVIRKQVTLLKYYYTNVIVSNFDRI